MRTLESMYLCTCSNLADIFSSHGTTRGRIEVVRREWWGLKGSLRHIAQEIFKPIISMISKGLFTRYECRCS